MTEDIGICSITCYLQGIKMVEEFKLRYPRTAKFIAGLPIPNETFLYDRMSNIEYPFWNEFEFYLSCICRFGDTDEIFRKLSLTASMENNNAWRDWQQFRSAEFEVSMIFFVETYFGGKITEVIPTGDVETPDFKVQFNQGEFTIEAKAQSGQQHGDKHPIHDNLNLFDPKEETDLRSWLFKERISSRNGKLMKPQAIAAENKGADILACQTDYTATKPDLSSQISAICPQNKFIERIILQSAQGKPMEACFFVATFPCARQLYKMKEIWLHNLSSSDYKLIVLTQKSSILMEHLKNGR